MSTPQLSLVLIKGAPRQSAEPSLKDIESFLSKFQIPYETFVGTHQQISDFCNKAQGQYIVLTNAELTSPLGDAFKLIQALSSSPDIEISFGNRFAKKESPFLHLQSERSQLDLIYTPIFRKHLRGLFQDPLCDLVAFKKSYWDKLKPQQKSELNQARWTPFLQRLCLETNARTADIPIYDNGQTDPAWPRWKRKFQMIWINAKF